MRFLRPVGLAASALSVLAGGLVVPTEQPAQALAPAAGPAGARPAYVVVTEGSTLSGLAARWSVTVASLVRLNRLADPDLIRLDQRLMLPAAVAGPSGPLVGSLPRPGPALRRSFQRWSSAYGVRLHLLEGLTWWESGGATRGSPPAGPWVSASWSHRPSASCATTC